jgi:hypothetical protein
LCSAAETGPMPIKASAMPASVAEMDRKITFMGPLLLHELFDLI